MKTNKTTYAQAKHAPDFINKDFNCTVCGAVFTVTPKTDVHLLGLPNSLGVHCPYCKCPTVLKNDINKNYKERLIAFVTSQVAPIKSIEDENIRLPMQKLLDDFYALLQE